MSHDLLSVAKGQKRTISGSNGGSKKTKRTKTTILSLPHECLRTITSHLTQEDTLSLLYSNSHFERACKVRLYRSIIICEKYQDHYFYELSKQKKVTILSGWDNILKFFRMFYMNHQQCTNTGLAKYVEEIATYNFLDRGRVDSYRVLSNSDLANILNLRQFWSTVLNSFLNLKVFVGPKLSIEKIFLLNERIAVNLHKISISIENDSALGSLDKYDIELPHLKILRLNAIQDPNSSAGPIINVQVCSALIKMLTVNGSKDNTTLEELELNASFGKQDRDTEHKLRHTKMTQGPSLTTSFIEGFKNAKSKLFDKKPSFSSNGLNYMSDDNDDGYDTDDNEEEEGERNEHDDDVFNDLVAQYSPENYSYQDYESEELLFDPRDLTSLPGLRKVEFENFNSKFNQQQHEILTSFVEIMVSNGIRFLNLKKLAIVNMRFKRHVFDNNSNFLKNFDKLIPYSYKLETLDFRNVHQDFFKFTNAEESRYDNDYSTNGFTGEHCPSLIKHLTNDITQNFVNLKKLVLFTTPYLGKVRLQSIGSGEFYRNPLLEVHSQLKEFSTKTPNLEELVIFGPETTQLKHIYRILYKSPARKVIKKLTYHQPELISQLSSKILNARIFQKFNKFKNLKILDDYYFGCSKKLVEHFITATRVENYCTNDLQRFNNDTLFFKDDFIYLFSDDARRFFRICPNLQEFTLYGFTFERNKNILV